MYMQSNKGKELLIIKTIFDVLKENEQFVIRNPKAAEAHDLMIDLWMIASEVEGAYELQKHDTTVSRTLLHAVLPQVHSMLYNFLLGNLPACYISMRVVLEAIVDAIIADTKFHDLPFPNNLELLKQHERKGLKFTRKCELLPAWAQNAVKEIDGLWRYLSNYWVHPKGTIRIIGDRKQRWRIVKRGPFPLYELNSSWWCYAPSKYHKRDLNDIQELVNWLHKLKEVVKILLVPFGKAEKPSWKWEY